MKLDGIDRDVSILARARERVCVCATNVNPLTRLNYQIYFRGISLAVEQNNRDMGISVQSFRLSGSDIKPRDDY